MNHDVQVDPLSLDDVLIVNTSKHRAHDLQELDTMIMKMKQDFTWIRINTLPKANCMALSCPSSLLPETVPPPPEILVNVSVLIRIVLHNIHSACSMHHAAKSKNKEGEPLLASQGSFEENLKYFVKFNLLSMFRF